MGLDRRQRDAADLRGLAPARLQNPAWGPTLSNNILLYVGFSQGYIDSGVRGQELNLAVMDLSEDKSLFVPTPAGWFEAFQRDFGLQIPLEAQKSLTLGLGGSGGPNYVPLDANQTFANITGCSLQGATSCSDEPLAACSASYRNMAQTLAPFSPYGDSTTAQCVNAFKRRLGGRPADAAETRAMLYMRGRERLQYRPGLRLQSHLPARGRLGREPFYRA